MDKQERSRRLIGALRDRVAYMFKDGELPDEYVTEHAIREVLRQRDELLDALKAIRTYPGISNLFAPSGTPGSILDAADLAIVRAEASNG